MLNSTKYDKLVTRCVQLESHLLPTINPALTYSDKEIDLTRAYCLLVHAEIEAYIEGIILEVSTRAFSKWNANKTIITSIIFHLAFAFKQEANKPKEPPYSTVVLSFKNLETIIKKNNGIKEENLSNMLRPIGYEVDLVLQTVLNDFGKNRGELAHTSFQTQKALDPATEKKNIQQIINGLKDFDQNLLNYEQSGNLNYAPFNLSILKSRFLWRLIKRIFGLKP